MGHFPRFTVHLTVHLTEAQRNGAGLSKYISTNDVSKRDIRPPTCYNGDECRFHRQHRCNYYHPLPPQARQARRPRQAPSSQWQSVSSSNMPGGARPGRQQGHQGWVAPRDTTATWCKHQENCLQGRFCMLRQEEEQDFSSQPQQSWN